MSLDRLVGEIELRGRRDLEAERGKVEAERQRIEADRNRRIVALRDEFARLATHDATRERTQRIARASLQARKLEYAAREQRMAKLLEQVRGILQEYTSSSDYPALLTALYRYAVRRLGKGIRVCGRVEDAALLKSIAGKGYLAVPTPVLGGLIGETADGARRINLTFDELLRLREDRLRALLGD